jgi:hypothetical protein
MMQASNIRFCSVCEKWIHCGQTIAHYREHAKAHRDSDRCNLPPANSMEIAWTLLANLLQNAHPLSGLESLRPTISGESLPSRAQIGTIMYMRRNQVESSIAYRVRESAFVKLAVDGWSDPRRRRDEGVTIRCITGNGETDVSLLSMKEIVSIHERSTERRSLLQHLREKFGIQDKFLNVCTDRGSMNQAAFRKKTMG